MRAVVFSDLHGHHSMVNAPTHLEDCVEIVKSVFKFAKASYVDCIIFVGDLFHQPKSLPVKVINTFIPLFDEMFALYNVPFIAISGNHDQAERRMYGRECETALTVFDKLFENFKLIDNQTINIAGTNIHGVPYYDYPEHLKQVLMELDPDEVDLLLLHNTPTGISNPHIPTEIDSTLLSYFPQVFVGHIHKPQQLLPNVQIIGTPKHNDRGDAGDKKYIYLYDSTHHRLTATATTFAEISALEKVVREKPTGERETFDFNPTTSSPQELLQEYAKELKIKDTFINFGIRCI